MSLRKRQQRIANTLAFLERDEEEKRLRKLRLHQEREESRHKKNVMVVDMGRPVCYWHWQVQKNSCHHGYLYVKTRFKINNVDKVVHVVDDSITTVPTTPRAGPQTPRPSNDPNTPRSARVVASTPRSAASTNSIKNDKGSVRLRYPGNAPKLKVVERGDKKGRLMVSTLRGTRVVARNDKDGLYYPGKVMRCPNVRHATVEFTYGPHEVLTRFIIPLSGAVPCPPLQVGDYVLVQVVNLEQGGFECYVPSVVQFTPKRRGAQPEFYNVKLYNGQKVLTRRLHMVKISKERYELSARYIAAVQGEDQNRMEDKVYVSQTPKESSPERAESEGSSDAFFDRPRSPTPGEGLHESPSPQSSPSGQEMRIVGLADADTQENDEDRSRTPERDEHRRIPSRSRSTSGSRSRSRSPRRIPSRSRSTSGSRSRSRSPNTPLTDRQKQLKKMARQLEKKDRESRRWRRKVKKLKQRLKDKEAGQQEQEQALAEEEVETLETPRLLRLRRSLPVLHPVEEVLARFSDDGWYYRGTVQQYLGDLSYIVEDASGYMERIWREDIISDYDESAPALRTDDKVVASHPNHSGSYAPGIVEHEDQDMQTVRVKFYDGQTGDVPRTEVYRLQPAKYIDDVKHIHRRQQEMLGLSVVARDDDSGVYYPGQLAGMDDRRQKYIVTWTDGSQCKQLPIHIFSAITRRPRLVIGDRVLALADPDLVIFLPGQVIGGQDGALMVRFCDGQIRDDVSPTYSYWLSQGYFEEALYYWKICQPDFGRSIESRR